MYQLANHILKDKDDSTSITILYANKTEQDILLREELESLSRLHPNRLKIWHTLESFDSDWVSGKGRIRKQDIAPAKESAAVLVCGPQG